MHRNFYFEKILFPGQIGRDNKSLKTGRIFLLKVRGIYKLINLKYIIFIILFISDLAT